VAHAVLLAGVGLFVFPVYVAFVASTRELPEVASGNMGLLPGPHASVNYWKAFVTDSGERIRGAPYRSPPNPAGWSTTPGDKELERQGGQDRFRGRTGLPVATYLGGPKLRWILDHVPGARQQAEAGDLLFGTVDTWLVWWLTGGSRGGVHITDVTNASRTLLWNLHTLAWEEEILRLLDIPRYMLPEVRSSCGVYGAVATGPLEGVPVAAVLGDQQAALFGQTCKGETTVYAAYERLQEELLGAYGIDAEAIVNAVRTLSALVG